MPLIEVTLVEGRSAAQLRTLVSALTQAAVQAVHDALRDVSIGLRVCATAPTTQR